MLLVGAASGPSAARAQEAAAAPSDAEARARFSSGRAHFDRGEYEEALADFDGAYQLSGRVELLYNVYLTLERLGRPSEAADRLEQYLRETTAIDAEQRTNLGSRLAHLRERARQEEADAAHARVPPPPPPAEPGLRPLGVAGVITAGAGGASLVAFAITGGLALAEDDSVGARCDRACTEDDVSSLRTLISVADATLAVGVILAAAGGVMLTIDLLVDRPDASPNVALAPLVSPTFVGVQLGGTL